MKVVEIRTEAEFQKLQPVWEALLSQSPSATVFLTWEWVTAWWAAYGKPGDLRVLLVLDESGAPVGIAPLRRGTVRRYRQTTETLAFIGDGSNDSDYLDFVIAAKHQAQVVAAIWEYWRDQRRECLLELNTVPATSESFLHLKPLAGESKVVWEEADEPCGVVSLPESWDEYLAMLRPRFRTKVRSVLRSLENRPEVTFHFCTSPAEIDRLLPALYDLHGRRWAADGKPGVFGWDRKREFYRLLSPMLLDRGRLRFSWLEWGGHILACQYGFVYDDAYFQLQEGYEPAAEHCNVGIGLRAWSIRELQREGIREYDFLAGVGRHKLDWGAAVKQSKRILAGAPTLKNRLLVQGPAWERSVKDRAATIIPEKVLAARRTRLASGAGRPRFSRETLTNIAANCYFHSGLPRLMRPVRNAFQLSERRDSLFKVSCVRRSHPASRILYYHRVNDDGDPFFPAMSTGLFEAQMRFLAKHYNVVSVPEMLDRLQNRDLKPVLAITFDDGYKDNFENALPILSRYNLPATIFLSTGGIDSRQPLWFEMLADALKRTECEHLDIEFVFPQRFLLRNTTERLKANDQIFELLRKVPDGHRRQWLTEILRQTRVDQIPRHDKMLTWDQIRTMRKHRIDFGGHTVSHPFLSKLTSLDAAWEVAECKRRIEQELQTPVEYFAYPNGREQDFGEMTKDALREAGYRAAMTTVWGTNNSTTDPFELRRGGPWEENPPMFAYKLDWYELVNG